MQPRQRGEQLDVRLTYTRTTRCDHHLVVRGWRTRDTGCIGVIEVVGEVRHALVDLLLAANEGQMSAEVILTHLGGHGELQLLRRWRVGKSADALPGVCAGDLLGSPHLHRDELVLRRDVEVQKEANALRALAQPCCDRPRLFAFRDEDALGSVAEQVTAEQLPAPNTEPGHSGDGSLGYRPLHQHLHRVVLCQQIHLA